MKEFKDKKVVVFDLDGTLTESKQALDYEMAGLLSLLLDKFLVGVISGGALEQFERQFLNHLSLPHEKLERLFILPTSGAAMYRHKDGKLEKIYAEVLSENDMERITGALISAIEESGHHNIDSHGPQIENRLNQITFSALGQNAPIEQKRAWDPDQKKRRKIIELLEKPLSDFHVRMGGTTSIDITRIGVDKAYGMRKFSEETGIPLSDKIFVGDALYPGGNDSAVLATEAFCVSVKDAEETKDFIRKLLG